MKISRINKFFGLIIYNIGIYFFVLFMKISSLFRKKRKELFSMQNKIYKNILKNLDQNKVTIWFHASSSGEFQIVKPLIVLLKKSRPDFQIVVSYFSPSAFWISKSKEEQPHYEFILPFDYEKNMKKLIRTIRPSLFILSKTDFWINLILQLSKHNVKMVLFSALFIKEKIFFKKNIIGKLFRYALSQFDQIFVVNESSKKLLFDQGIKSQIINDFRYTNVYKNKNIDFSNKTIEEFIGKSNVFIIGSLRNEDLSLIVPFINQEKDFKYIIVPHEISENFLLKIENLLIVPTIRYTEKILNLKSNVMILDTYGLLAYLYRYANIVYIGGGFSNEPHNVLEASVYGVPVFVGNFTTQKHPEIDDLVKEKLVFKINNLYELNKYINLCMENKDLITNKCNEYFEKKQAHPEEIIDFFYNNKLLPK